MKKFIEKILDLCLRWILIRKRIKPFARCLACGDRGRKHIKYDPSTRKVLSMCNVCSAVRAHNPVVAPQAWDFIGRDLENEQKYETDVMSLFAERKPLEVKA